MKVYFLAAISAIDEYRTVYLEIIATLKAAKYEVMYEHIMNRIPNADRAKCYPVPDDRDYFNQVCQSIRSCEFVVAEITKLTPNVAYEIAFAIENNVPVLCLSSREAPFKSPLLLAANTNTNLVFKKYSPTDLVESLKRDLHYMENLINDKKSEHFGSNIKHYLNWISKRSGISHNLYMRKLIEKDMLSNAKYAQSLRV